MIFPVVFARCLPARPKTPRCSSLPSASLVFFFGPSAEQTPLDSILLVELTSVSKDLTTACVSTLAATLEPTMRLRGRLGPRAGIPKRQLPYCHSCQRGTFKPACVAHEREGAQRPQCAKGRDPRTLALRRHSTLRWLSRQPLTERFLRRATGQARRGHFPHVLRLGSF